MSPSIRTNYSPTVAPGDHLFGGVLIAEHRATCIHRHLPVECLDRCCIPRSLPSQGETTQVIFLSVHSKLSELTFQERFHDCHAGIGYHL